jgi:hypothetical protein
MFLVQVVSLMQERAQNAQMRQNEGPLDEVMASSGGGPPPAPGGGRTRARGRAQRRRPTTPHGSGGRRRRRPAASRRRLEAQAGEVPEPPVPHGLRRRRRRSSSRRPARGHRLRAAPDQPRHRGGHQGYFQAEPQGPRKPCSWSSGGRPPRADGNVLRSVTYCCTGAEMA